VPPIHAFLLIYFKLPKLTLVNSKLLERRQLYTTKQTLIGK